jgi:hypothetical protein
MQANPIPSDKQRPGDSTLASVAGNAPISNQSTASERLAASSGTTHDFQNGEGQLRPGELKAVLDMNAFAHDHLERIVGDLTYIKRNR